MSLLSNMITSNQSILRNQSNMPILAILDSIKNSINITFTRLNNMCNNSYIYSLNSYKNKFIESSKLHNIDDIRIIDEYLLIQLKNEYFPEVEKRILYIESIPLIEQKTPEWFKQRETMISASDAGYFLKSCGVARAVDSLKIKVGLKSYVSSGAPPLIHGNTYEDVSRAIYESRNCVSVTEYGILSSPTKCIGASPDGIVTNCHKDTYKCQSKFGRLLEIKNPYSREIDNDVKPEYMVQILQQQYTTQLPICDFVETTIVDAYCNTNNTNYKPYMTLNEMLSDTIDKTNPIWEKRIKNKNIPDTNLNKFGNEKGLLVWYKKRITDTDIRDKYIMYPLTALYDTLTIEKWIVDTNSEQFKLGYKSICTKYWRLDVYSEKTVVYDQSIFEGQYIPKLCAVWDVITKCNALRLEDGNVANYIEEEEANINSPFYNERKLKKKAKLGNTKDNGNGEDNGNGKYNGNGEDNSNGDINPNIAMFKKAFKPNKDIELDF